MQSASFGEPWTFRSRWLPETWLRLPATLMSVEMWLSQESQPNIYHVAVLTGWNSGDSQRKQHLDATCVADHQKKGDFITTVNRRSSIRMTKTPSCHSDGAYSTKLDKLYRDSASFAASKQTKVNMKSIGISPCTIHRLRSSDSLSTTMSCLVRAGIDEPLRHSYLLTLASAR